MRTSSTRRTSSLVLLAGKNRVQLLATFPRKLAVLVGIADLHEPEVIAIDVPDHVGVLLVLVLDLDKLPDLRVLSFDLYRTLDHGFSVGEQVVQPVLCGLRRHFADDDAFGKTTFGHPYGVGVRRSAVVDRHHRDAVLFDLRLDVLDGPVKVTVVLAHQTLAVVTGRWVVYVLFHQAALRR